MYAQLPIPHYYIVSIFYNSHGRCSLSTWTSLFHYWIRKPYQCRVLVYLHRKSSKYYRIVSVTTSRTFFTRQRLYQTADAHARADVDSARSPTGLRTCCSVQRTEPILAALARRPAAGCSQQRRRPPAGCSLCCRAAAAIIWRTAAVLIVGLERTAKLSKQTWRDVASACVPD